MPPKLVERRVTDVDVEPNTRIETSHSRETMEKIELITPSIDWESFAAESCGVFGSSCVMP